VELTPEDRDSAQMYYLRAWLGRKRRAQWNALHQPVPRFDMAGNKEPPIRKGLSGDGRQAANRARAEARRIHFEPVRW
jgi:hypothetical protein